MYIVEKQKNIPIIVDADVCVLGGSCTGVFAAIRAARLGANVVIVEKQNCFGGTATVSGVCIWHSFKDFKFDKDVIAGLSLEVIERLKKRDLVKIDLDKIDSYIFNTEELKIELDEMILEAGVKPYLHTSFVDVISSDNTIEAVIVENKSGRGAIKAKMFIDCTGDGDLCERLGIESYKSEFTQPSTVCAKMTGLEMELYGLGNIGSFDLNKAFLEHKDEFGIKHDGWGWSCEIPNVQDVSFQAITKVVGYDCASGEGLTYAEMEGRKQLRAIHDLIRKYGPQNSEVGLVDISAYIGIRETRHYRTMYKLTENDCLNGSKFDDAIANCTMRVDMHHSDKAGCTFKFMDGTCQYMRSGFPTEYGRWRAETTDNPTYYQIPYRSIITDKFDNLLLAGRMIDADRGGFASARVMVNLNQLGEAAGVAACTAIEENKTVCDINTDKLREKLKIGGSIVL